MVAFAAVRVVAALSRLGSGGGGVGVEERGGGEAGRPQSEKPSRQASMAVSGSC